MKPQTLRKVSNLFAKEFRIFKELRVVEIFSRITRRFWVSRLQISHPSQLLFSSRLSVRFHLPTLFRGSLRRSWRIGASVV